MRSLKKIRLLKPSNGVVLVLTIYAVVATIGWWNAAQPAAIVWGNVAEWVAGLSTLALVIGLIPAFREVRSGVDAVRAQQRDTKAELLMQFNSEWRSKSLYEAIMYLHGLRDSWATTGGSVSQLAKDWVKGRVHATDERLKREWGYRRQVAQYLRHTGYLLANGYLEVDDVFSVNAEAGRLLEVILPIENAVMEFFGSLAHNTSVAGEFARKWELDYLLEQYRTWYADNLDRRFGPHPIIPKELYTTSTPDKVTN
jgi:hypothetical protein